MNIILVIALFSGVVADDFELPPDIVYDNTTVGGTFLGFEVGDYIHSVIMDRNGEVHSFWSTDPLMDYFLSLHVDETVTLSVQEVDTYLIEEEEMLHIFRVVGASVSGTSYTEWKDSVETLGTPEELLGDYFRAPYQHVYHIR